MPVLESLGLLILPSLLAAAPVPPELLVRIDGARALPPEVYLAALQLPEGAAADEPTRLLVEEQLQSFLYRAGYDLSSVRAQVQGEQLHVALREGRLEKVVFRGRLSLQTIRLKAEFALPHEVFNRPLVERQLRELTQKFGIERTWYELVPTEQIRHLGPQVEDLGSFKGLELVHGQEPWELHIFFGDKEWWTGPGVDLRSGYFDGLELGGNYQGEAWLFPSDRYRLALSGGLGLRNRLHDDQLYPAFSRTAAELVYFGPAGLVRPIASVRGELLARQRFDLDLENYWNAQLDGALELQHELGRQQALSLGAGVRYQRLFDFTPAETRELLPFLRDIERFRPFAQLRLGLLFETPENRWDRRHELWGEARHFFALRDPVFGEARLSYQRVFAWGWHDVWVRGRGAWLWGEVPFHYEELIAGTHVRSVFGDTYVHRVVSGSAEFRFSLTRDLFKLSVFHDLAVYGELDRATGREVVRMAGSIGPGFHALIEGMLQLDLYVAFGLDSRGRFDTGVAAILQKVF